MTNGTCVEAECASPAKVRYLCRRHYGTAYRSGNLPPLAPKPPRHLLSDVDLDRATATCAICGPVNIRVRRDGKSHECKILRRLSRGSGPDAKARYTSRLKHKYGITPEVREAMAASQDGLCAICNTAPSKLVIDHDHTTGLVRQLLCQHCNSAIGFLRDDPEIARAAVQYIEKHLAA